MIFENYRDYKKEKTARAKATGRGGVERACLVLRVCSEDSGGWKRGLA